MSKKITPLEALKELRYRITNFNGKFHNYNELMGTIETALKEKENMEKTIDELFNNNGKVITTIEIKNKLKALEIIKEKRVNVSLLLNLRILKMYNDWVDDKTRNLTEEQFDLLKEVLL